MRTMFDGESVDVETDINHLGQLVHDAAQLSAQVVPANPARASERESNIAIRPSEAALSASASQ